MALNCGIGIDFSKNINEKVNYNEIIFDKKYSVYTVYSFPQIPYLFRFFKQKKMLHFTFQNMRAFYGPWPRGLGLNNNNSVQFRFSYNTITNVAEPAQAPAPGKKRRIHQSTAQIPLQ